MFGRKKPSEDVPKPSSDFSQGTDLPTKLANKLAAAASPPRSPILPPRPQPDTPRPAGEAPRRAELMPTPLPGSAAKRDSELRKLIVGRGISLSGEITSCDRLVVEGSVEANLAGCRDIEIAETGIYKGSAAISAAEIRGRFEGSLNVRGRLFIKATGRVTGTVRYTQIEIEVGGQISGDVQAHQTNEPASVEAPPPVKTNAGVMIGEKNLAD